jgi:hypothetical protein
MGNECRGCTLSKTWCPLRTPASNLCPAPLASSVSSKTQNLEIIKPFRQAALDPRRPHDHAVALLSAHGAQIQLLDSRHNPNRNLELVSVPVLESNFTACLLSSDRAARSTLPYSSLWALTSAPASTSSFTIRSRHSDAATRSLSSFHS